MNKKIVLSFAIGLSTTLAWNYSPACSNVFIYGGKQGTGSPYFASVARNMDFGLITGNTFGYGAVGVENVSNINMHQLGLKRPTRWKNQYAFFGQTAIGTSYMTDGVNTAGLYAGMLEFPNYTAYPTHRETDRRSELGVLDVINYVLGTSASVPEAINNLRNQQIVINAATIDNLVFVGFAFHVVLRDKSGNSAVIEWLDETSDRSLLEPRRGVTHYYVHEAYTDEVIETIDTKQLHQPDLSAQYPKVYPNSNGAIVTNAPPYGVQLESAAEPQWLKMKTGNTDKTIDNSKFFLNGSGIYGIPGDYTSPSRFIKGSVLTRLMPSVKSQNQAMLASLSILQTLVAPAGSAPDPTIWQSWVDLTTSTYKFRPLLYPVTEGLTEPKRQFIATPLIKPVDWESISVASIGTPKPAWVKVKSELGKTVPLLEVPLIYKMINEPTPGNFEMVVDFLPPAGRKTPFARDPLK